MIRHSQQQPEEALVYYTYQLFSSSPQVACLTSTRLGGVSQGHLHSLNLSFRVGDEEEAVLTNKERFYRLLNIDAETVAQAQLVHGAHIEIVREYAPRDARYKFPSTDGLVTNLIDRPLFIPVADCLAIAYADPKHHAIGLAHVGWKGAVAKIPQEMVKVMHTAYGTEPADLLVGVSPGLGPCCYEVQQDLVTIFTETFPTEAHRFFIPQANGSIHLDMWTAVLWQLQDVGVQAEHIELANICTACHTDEFYSHRAEKGKTGRFASMIVLQS
jgi:YfiH family protein